MRRIKIADVSAHAKRAMFQNNGLRRCDTVAAKGGQMHFNVSACGAGGARRAAFCFERDQSCPQPFS